MRNAVIGGVFSVLLMSTVAHATATDIALNKTIVAVSSEFSSDYSAAYAVDGFKGDTTNAGVYPYWLTANGVTTGWVTIDLGAVYNITSFLVSDTHNGSYVDRGTNAFSIGVGSTAAESQSNVTASSSFSLSDWQNLTDKTVTASATGEFVTFNILSAYGNGLNDPNGPYDTANGGGLGELAVFGTLAAVPAPEPMTMALLGTGLLGLIAARRRSV